MFDVLIIVGIFLFFVIREALQPKMPPLDKEEWRKINNKMLSFPDVKSRQRYLRKVAKQKSAEQRTIDRLKNQK